MRAMHPIPAKMQSCLARIVPEARCFGSMQAALVASRVARSSSSAFSIMAVVRRVFSSMAVVAIIFFQQTGGGGGGGVLWGTKRAATTGRRKIRGLGVWEKDKKKEK